MLMGVMAMAVGGLPEVLGGDVGVRLVRSGGEIIEELLVKDATGKFRKVLVSPTHASVALKAQARPSAVQGATDGLFTEAPSMAFSTYQTTKAKDRIIITLQRDDENLRMIKTITVPLKGRLLKVRVDARFKKPAPRIRYLLSSYAFAPDGKPMRSYGKPDSTFSPGLRPNGSNVVGDHFFRAPMISIQRGGIAALIMPDLDVLAENRPIPTIIDLDCTSGVVDAPLMSYGFADYKVSGHVYFTNDASMTRSVPKNLRLAYDILLDAQAEPFGAYRQAVPYLWKRYGKANFDKVLPQAMPFEEYARVSYPAAFTEAYGANKLGWFEVEIDGQICGGIPSGWGFLQGWVSWQSWFNQLRSAWGLRWWGKRLGEKDWVDKADKMLNLALAAPMKDGAVPTTYQSREKQWKGTLIAPDPRAYYDLTNMAWKGIWLLRWLEFDDVPRREEILRQCREMADLMVRVQNKDGSIPTWLDKDLKVIPILDNSAQTALPAWFLAELALSYKPSKSNWSNAAQKAADFLVKEVIDGQYYYDFETFFSCSPKQCLQRDGKVDHEAMRDPYTLQAPQNTLSMQWAAEALMAVNRLGPNPKSEIRNRKSLMALDIMALYQNVWSLPYRKTAYTFGGFGVQNSDGEFLDARQAQFGATLADIGAMLGRQDYFERGVAATRASMTLINHPLHEQLGLYPKPNYPYGLQPENCGHGGVDHQNGRTGFDWGEGSGLSSMAWLLHKYGGAYVDEKNRWAVGIDNVTFDANNDRLFDHKRGVITIEDRRRVDLQIGRVRTQAKDTIPFPFVFQTGLAGRQDTQSGAPDLDDLGLYISFWGLASNDFKGEFVNSDGAKSKAASLSWAEQSGFNIGSSVSTKFPEAWSGKEIRLRGKWLGSTVEFGPFVLFLNPVFDFNDWQMRGWTVVGDFADIPTYPTRLDFGIPKTEPFIGTCEDGRGSFDDTYLGTITSPKFLVTKPAIKLLVGGGSGDGVYVELLDEAGKQVAIARGKNREQMDEVVWDVSKYKGQSLQIRIVDKETGGWGHINVARIRCE